MRDIIPRGCTLNQYFVDVDLHRDSQYLCEDLIHQPLISCPCIFQIEGHYFVAIKSAISDDGGVFLILRKHGDLIVTRMCVHEADEFMAHGRVDHLVNSGHRKAVLRKGFVEVGEIHAASPSSVWLRN